MYMDPSYMADVDDVGGAGVQRSASPESHSIDEASSPSRPGAKRKADASNLGTPQNVQPAAQKLLALSAVSQLLESYPIRYFRITVLTLIFSRCLGCVRRFPSCLGFAALSWQFAACTCREWICPLDGTLSGSGEARLCFACGGDWLVQRGFKIISALHHVKDLCFVRHECSAISRHTCCIK